MLIIQEPNDRVGKKITPIKDKMNSLDKEKEKEEKERIKRKSKKEKQKHTEEENLKKVELQQSEKIRLNFVFN